MGRRCGFSEGWFGALRGAPGDDEAWQGRARPVLPHGEPSDSRSRDPSRPVAVADPWPLVCSTRASASSRSLMFELLASSASARTLMSSTARALVCLASIGVLVGAGSMWGMGDPPQR